MAEQLSPGIKITEFERNTTVPAVSSTTGAVGGVFGWGPVGKLLLITSENDLVSKYGRPNSSNYETFFSAANYLAYSNSLYVSRAAVTTGFSNTVSTNLNGNTTVVVTSNSTSITSGLGVYGSGIPAGATVVSATVNGANTNVVLTANATLGNSTVASTQTVQFFDTKYSFNAVANTGAAASRGSYLVKNKDHFETVTVPAGVEFVARYPGDRGNSLKISVCDSAAQFNSTVNPYDNTVFTFAHQNANAGITVNVNEATGNVFMVWNPSAANLTYAQVKTNAEAMRQKFIVGDVVTVGNSSIGTQLMKIKTIDSGITNNNIDTAYFNVSFESPYTRSTNFYSNTITRSWEYFNTVSAAPGTSGTVANTGSTVVDQMHVVVVDNGGQFTGVPGTILETYEFVSRATNGKNTDGSVNYYKTAINEQSSYIWSVNDRTGAVSNTAATVTNSSETTPYTRTFVGGADGLSESSITMAAMAQAYDLYTDAASIDISNVITGKNLGVNGTQLANYLIDNIASVRKDCLVYVSPQKSDVINNDDPITSITTFMGNLRPSTYSVRDSGYKYMYDKYNDVYRWVPLNGDIAGVKARVDATLDPWMSPAGVTKGQIKNIVKLGWNPSTEAAQTSLYKLGVNPVVTFSATGEGTVLYGDKTGVPYSSAFDHINIRSLFITMEKAIGKAAKRFLFEQNDEFSRAQFKNIVEPYLRSIEGRRGIIEFKVVCDETNNPDSVVAENRFVGDIYVRPTPSINYIQLNFVNVRGAPEFNEIVGSGSF